MLILRHNLTIQLYEQVDVLSGEPQYWFELVLHLVVALALLFAWHGKTASGVLAAFTAVNLVRIYPGQQVPIIVDGAYFVAKIEITQSAVLLGLLIVLFIFGTGSLRT